VAAGEFLRQKRDFGLERDRGTFVERSNSATAPSTVNTILPAGVDVSSKRTELQTEMTSVQVR